MSKNLRHTVREAQRGNKKAAQELIDQFMPLIKKEAARHCHAYQSMDEALSTAHAAAVECIHAYDLTRADPVQWRMKNAVCNLFSNESYHAGRYQQHVDKCIREEGGITDLPCNIEDKTRLQPEAQYLHDEEYRRLYDAIRMLSPQYQAFIYLRFWENWTYLRLAKAHGVSPKTARNIITRALTSLREEWGTARYIM